MAEGRLGLGHFHALAHSSVGELSEVAKGIGMTSHVPLK